MIEILDKYWLLLLVGQYPHGPLGGITMTMIIAIVALIVSLPLAILFALARTSGIAVLERPVLWLVTIVRGLPFLMFVFWVYFGFPSLFGISLGGTTTMIVALIIYESAYISEIVRAGIEAIPKGQLEAANALGLKYGVRTFRIVLPQALFNMLPSLITQFASIVKETSVGYIISAQEFTFAATQANNLELTKPLEVFATLALGYYLLCGGIALIARIIERRILRRREGASATVELRLAAVVAT
jgi:polar amino acid transport system permease protein